MIVRLLHGRRHKDKLTHISEGIKLFGHETMLTRFDNPEEVDKAEGIVSFGNVVVPKVRPWMHVDNSFFGRHRYFRASVNTNNPGQYMMRQDMPNDRWKALRVEMKPWTSNERGPIIFCTSSSRNSRWLGINIGKEIKNAINTIKSNCRIDREIIIRTKKDARYSRLSDLLETAYALVVWGSNSACEAIVAGVPVFSLHNNGANPMSHSDLRFIESPLRLVRDQWAANLAYQQWTLDEFRRGTPWRILVEENIYDTKVE